MPIQPTGKETKTIEQRIFDSNRIDTTDAAKTEIKGSQDVARHSKFERNRERDYYCRSGKLTPTYGPSDEQIRAEVNKGLNLVKSIRGKLATLQKDPTVLSLLQNRYLLQILQYCLKSENPKLNIKAAFLLGMLGFAGKPLESQLAWKLFHENPKVRYFALMGLVGMAPVSEGTKNMLTKTLGTSLKKKELLLVLTILTNTGKLSSNIETKLVEIMKNETSEDKLSKGLIMLCIRALSQISPPSASAEAEIFKMISNKDPDIKLHAIFTLSECRNVPESTISKLADIALERKDPKMAQGAMYAIMRIGKISEATARKILPLTRSLDETTRASALWALALGPRQVALEQALYAAHMIRHPNTDVCAAALAVLISLNIQNKALANELIEGTKDERFLIKANFVSALATLGQPEKRAVIKRLNEMLQEPNSEALKRQVRDTIKWLSISR